MKRIVALLTVVLFGCECKNTECDQWTPYFLFVLVDGPTSREPMDASEDQISFVSENGDVLKVDFAYLENNQKFFFVTVVPEVRNYTVQFDGKKADIEFGFTKVNSECCGYPLKASYNSGSQGIGMYDFRMVYYVFLH